MYICPFMSTADKKVECTVQCALCVNGTCIIRTNAAINEDIRNTLENVSRTVKRI